MVTGLTLLERPAGAARAEQPDVEGDHDHGRADHGEQGCWPALRSRATSRNGIAAVDRRLCE